MKLTIAGTGIHTDAEGRFSLNNLHAASGGNPTHRPGEFLRLQQTQDLIAEIETAGFPAVRSKEGRGGGTYARKELVYAYAMWISASFQLKVIRAFDALTTGNIDEAQRIANPRSTTPAKMFPDYYKVARLIGCDKNAAAISANNAVFKKTGENVLSLLGNTHLETEGQELYFNVSDLVDGISGQRMNKMLVAAGLQTRQGNFWSPTQAGKVLCRIFDTGKRHSDGTPVQQIKWSRDVLPTLNLGEAA